MSRRLKPELELITASKLTPHTILLRIHVMREYDTPGLRWSMLQAALPSAVTESSGLKRFATLLDH